MQNISEKRRKRVQLVLVAAASMVASTTYAGTWTGATNNDWNTGTNWDTTNVPSPTTVDNVTVAATASPFVVNYSSVGAGYADATGGRLGTLTLSSASSINSTLLTVSANNFAFGGKLFVGANSTLDVTTGGGMTVSIADTDIAGLLKVSGGTFKMTTNNGANGRLTVGSGATSGTISLSAGSFTAGGSATDGTSILNPAISVGQSNSGTASGTGIINVSDGTFTNFGTLVVASAVGAGSSSRTATGTINVSNGTWINSKDVIIGRFNTSNTSSVAGSSLTGTIAVTGGEFRFATSSNAVMTVGGASSNGFLNVSGAGQVGDATNVVSGIVVSGLQNSVANASVVTGTGVMSLSGGAVWTKSLTANQGAKSQIAFNGGTLNTGGTDFAGINAANGTTFIVGDGTNAATLNLIGGGSGTHTFADGLVVSTNAALTGAGAINGAATVNGSLDAGNAADSTGAMAFNSGLTLSGSAQSTFEFSDPSAAAGTFDQISNDGQDAVNFGGTLVLAFSGGSYLDGSTFPIFNNFGSYAGGFTTLSYSGLGTGQTAVFDPATGVVSIAVPEPTAVTCLAMGGFFLLNRRRRNR